MENLKYEEVISLDENEKLKKVLKLVTKGKKRGKLTTKEINEVLNDFNLNKDNIVDVYKILKDENIEIINNKKEKNKSNNFNKRESDNYINFNNDTNILKYISQNPFYILNLSSKAFAEEINDSEDYIRKKINLGIDYTPDHGDLFFEEKEIIEGDLNNALANLKNNDKRLIYRIFWFHDPSLVFNELNEKNIWFKSKKLFDKDNVKNKHDGALLALLYNYKFDRYFKNFDKWIKTIEMWKELINTHEYFQFIKNIESKNRIIDSQKNNIFNKFKPKNIIDIIFNHTLIILIKNSIKEKKFKTFKRGIDFLIEVNYFSKYKNDIFSKFSDEFSNEVKNIYEIRKNIIYEKEIDTNSLAQNELWCNKEYKRYTQKIEPMLTVGYYYLSKKDYLLHNLRENAAKLVKNISVDYTWSKNFTKAKKCIYKGLKISYDLPIEVELEEAKERFGEYKPKFNKVFKDGSNIINNYIFENPFRLLDLSVTASDREINRELKMLKIKIKYGFNCEPSWDLGFINKINKYNFNLDGLEKNIFSPINLLKSKILWFNNRENIISDLNKESILETANYMYDYDNYYKHDGALMTFIYLIKYDKEFNKTNDWYKALKNWEISIKNISEDIYKKNINNDELSDEKIKKIAKKIIKKIYLKINFNEDADEMFRRYLNIMSSGDNINNISNKNFYRKLYLNFKTNILNDENIKKLAIKLIKTINKKMQDEENINDINVFELIDKLIYSIFLKNNKKNKLDNKLVKKLSDQIIRKVYIDIFIHNSSTKNELANRLIVGMVIELMNNDWNNNQTKLYKNIKKIIDKNEKKNNIFTLLDTKINSIYRIDNNINKKQEKRKTKKKKRKMKIIIVVIFIIGFIAFFATI